MKNILFLISAAAVLLSFPAAADEDAFLKAGIDAFNAQRFDEAERLLKNYESVRPDVRVMMDIIRSKRRKDGAPSYDVFLERLNKGDTDQLNNFGIVPRYKAEISGLSGNMYLQRLFENVKNGDTASVYRAALLYQEGIGVPRDLSKALDLFEKAAQSDHADALNAAGVYLRFGIGRDKPDPAKAKEYLTRAVLLNNTSAFYNLGLYYFESGDPVQASVLAEFGKNRLKPTVSKKEEKRFATLKKKAERKLAPLQKAYFTRFVPFWLSPVATPQDLNGRIYPKKLPPPPTEMIRETKFFFPLKRDAYNNKYKTFFPFMPAWVPFDADQPENPALAGKKRPFPAPDDEEAVRTLYYRVSYPATLHLLLTKPKAGIPVMVGDVFEIAVYTKLHDTPQTKKGAHMYINNTEYKIVLESPDDAIITDRRPVLTPLSIATRNSEVWLSQGFEAKKPGVAVLKFVPTNGGFAHTLLIQSSVGKAPR